MKTIIPALLLAAALPVAAQSPQGGATGQSPTQMFMQQMDADQNGSVSLEEFQKPTNEQFKYMDKNGDGSITTDEVDAFHQEMQQRMQQMQQRMQQQGGGQPPGGYGAQPGYGQPSQSGYGAPAQQGGGYGQYRR